MADARKPLTAAELDVLSPDQRAAAVRDGLVTDLDDVPDEFRRRVINTGRRLADELRTRTGE
jgi:hypothetical protein